MCQRHDQCYRLNLQHQSIWSFQNLQSVIIGIIYDLTLTTIISRRKILKTKKLWQNIVPFYYTFPLKFPFNKILSDFMSRWIYTGTEWSWIYSRPLTTSKAIRNLVDHVIGSFSANSIHINYNITENR
jgi:hypothetical protein